ncbi:hypothetical protein [Actinoplanes friuliensis]|uniref:Lipoprotein n=1 Tax=Actinoplanes friuliensis DSM 7358 TaxID=1246995 RepID=U5W6E6_9ACTN|nr:hypothetical protein [Actinoplanes friuliensis]AGZ44562.1 hypothetical protein AFR_31510 [Actinoplanes friuliensis DSM 7358]
MTSRNVALTAAFLGLAAGGTAACDNTLQEEKGYPSDSTTYSSTGDTSSSSSSSSSSDDGDDYVEEEDEGADQVFYCADEEGVITAAAHCKDPDSTSSYFLWHSSTYARGLKPGTRLDGGEGFPAGDREMRRSFKLPSVGTVKNGTVKTNVVGRSSGSTSGTSSGGSDFSGFTGSSGG